MMKYLVTGAAGFIGTHLRERLLIEGHSVIGIDSFESSYEKSLKKANLRTIDKLKTTDFSFINARVQDISSRELDEIDGIFHLAGKPGVRSSWGSRFQEYLLNNVQATQNLFEANKGRVPIVYASSSSVYGDQKSSPFREETTLNPKNPYGISKVSCELLADVYRQRFPGRYVGLRLFSVYGPRHRPDLAFSKICNSLMTGEPFSIFGDGEQIRDFTYVSDVVEAILAIFQSSGDGIFNVGSSQLSSLNNAIKIFESASGKSCKIEFSDKVGGEMQITSSDNSKIFELCKWEPAVSLELGIRQQWEWFSSTFDSD